MNDPSIKLKGTHALRRTQGARQEVLLQKVEIDLGDDGVCYTVESYETDNRIPVPSDHPAVIDWQNECDRARRNVELLDKPAAPELIHVAAELDDAPPSDELDQPEIPPGAHECPFCDGIGKAPSLENPDLMEECVTCDGLGWIMNNESGDDR